MTPVALRREGVEVLMTDLQVPPDEFSYGHSKIFIRNPRTVQSRNAAGTISPAHFDISALRRTIFSQRNACNTGWAAHAPPPFSLQQLACNQPSANTWFHLTV